MEVMIIINQNQKDNGVFTVKKIQVIMIMKVENLMITNTMLIPVTCTKITRKPEVTVVLRMETIIIQIIITTTTIMAVDQTTEEDQTTEAAATV